MKSHRDLDRVFGDVGDLLTAHDDGSTDFTRYADDPVGFFVDVLGAEPWEAQVEIAKAVRDHELVSVRGCNSSGKDWTGARLALWWTYCKGGLALVTGPTQRQVREIVMQEVARAFHGAKETLRGELYASALRIGQNEARGIRAFTSTEASRLTGFHGGRVFAILTEAQGVEPYTWEGMLACATGDDDRILALGNPLRPSGRFYDVSTSGSWSAIQISASDHPNVQEGRTIIPGGPSAKWCERIANEYGRGSGTYRSRVLGEFPDEGEESIFRRSWLEEAATRWEDDAFKKEAGAAEPLVAVDPARYGPDSTALAVRRGPHLERIITWHGRSTTETTDRVTEEAMEAGIYPKRENTEIRHGTRGNLVVDSVGVGASVVDQLEDRGFRVRGYNGGQFTTSGERDRFLNERAKSHWKLRKLLEGGEIALPPDTKLFDELMSVRWYPTAEGKIRIEAKTDLKGRLGRSPDRADAVVMAFSGIEQTGRATSIPFRLI